MPEQEALILGLDRCDDIVVGTWQGNEARARSLSALLAHPCLGAFGTSQLQTLLGARVHRDALEATLYRFLVRNPAPGARLFVHFAVPVLAVEVGGQRRHYFVTRDLNVRRLLDNPFAGLSLEQLVDDHFAWSPAQEILALIDGPFLGLVDKSPAETRPHLRAIADACPLQPGPLEPGRAILCSTVSRLEPLGTHVAELLNQPRPDDERPRVLGGDLVLGLRERLGDQCVVRGSEPERLAIELSYPMTAKARIVLESHQQGALQIEEPHPLEQMALQLQYFCDEMNDRDPQMLEFLGPEAAHGIERQELEASVLDSWRGTYGELPASLVQRRKEIFDSELDRITTWFQPIVRLGRRHVRIAGWEALARDPETERIPQRLFNCVELWGEPFVSELDAHLAGTAVELFHHLIQGEPRLAPQRDLYDLSINVYPESLMSESYFLRLAELLAAELILPERLVLEISEKQELPTRDPETGEDPFRDMLKRFVRELGVHFSIDDLGEGHATIDRLQDLDPLHVKIDRSVLQHEDVASELAYLIDLVGPGHLSPPRIVVEGVDEHCPLTLPELFEVGVKFVQGFSIARPDPELHPLDEDLSRFLAERMAEELGPRRVHHR